MKKTILRFFSLSTAALFLAASAIAAPQASAPASELDRRIWTAKEIVRQIMQSPDQSIPEELLAKCKAIAIYPSVLKGAFIFGAKWGRGVVLKRDDKTGEWGPVAFSTIGGLNAGFQIGGQSTDLILVIMNDRGLDGLLSNHCTLGADASVAAGPIGRYSSTNTDLHLKASVLSYSRSWGLFAGVALDGAILTSDNNSNSAYYGRPMTSREILMGNAVKVQPSSEELVESLNEYSARWAGNPRPINRDNAIQSQRYDVEGEIIDVNYKEGEITVLETRPLDQRPEDGQEIKRVRVEPSTLARFKLRDNVKIVLNADRDKNSAQYIAKA